MEAKLLPVQFPTQFSKDTVVTLSKNIMEVPLLIIMALLFNIANGDTYVPGNPGGPWSLAGLGSLT